MGDPNQSAEYRVVIDRKDEEWTMSSQIHMPDDDEWFEFLRIEYEPEE